MTEEEKNKIDNPILAVTTTTSEEIGSKSTRDLTERKLPIVKKTRTKAETTILTHHLTISSIRLTISPGIITISSGRVSIRLQTEVLRIKQSGLTTTI